MNAFFNSVKFTYNPKICSLHWEEEEEASRIEDGSAGSLPG